MKNRINYLIITLPFIIGLIVGSFYDLEISRAVYINPNTNQFGLVFSAYMPLISYAFLSFGGGYIAPLVVKEKSKILRLFFILCSIVALGSSIYFTGNKFDSINAYGDSFSFVTGMIIGTIGESFIYFLGILTGKKYVTTRMGFCLIILFIMFAIELVPVSQTLKGIFRRPRYRTLVCGSDFYVEGSAFVNWWEPFKDQYKVIEQININNDVLSEHFKAFPSGHTSEAAMAIFGMAYLTKMIPSLEKKENLFVIIGLCFTLLMGFSRMTMGAHYLTDVCAGALLILILLIIGNEINLKILSKEKKD